MTTFVLVHGGWGGGWEWRMVADGLASLGHDAYRPTLTGLGERRHLATRETDLDTHIRDVIALLEMEDLRDIVLLGHSYGGAVVTGVADRVPERVARLVYLEGFVLRDGESVNDLTPAPFVAALRDNAASGGDGWLAAFPLDDVGVPDDLTDWYASRMSRQPLATLDQPLRLQGRVDDLPRSYIFAPEDGEGAGSLFRRFWDRAVSERWDCHLLPVGHDAQVIAPDLLVALLDRIANATTPGEAAAASASATAGSAP
jgi:pimeloyl-ACP methyl ester carboxylesterase